MTERTPLPRKIVGTYVLVSDIQGRTGDRLNPQPNPDFDYLKDPGIRSYNVVYIACLYSNSVRANHKPEDGIIRISLSGQYNNTEDFVSSLRELRKTGIKVILSIGGAGITMLFSDENTATFESLTTIIDVDLGGEVDGVDLNTFENIPLNPDRSYPLKVSGGNERMAEMCVQLAWRYKNFIIASPPTINGDQPKDIRGFSPRQRDMETLTTIARAVRGQNGCQILVSPQLYDSKNNLPAEFAGWMEDWLAAGFDPAEMCMGLSNHTGSDNQLANVNEWRKAWDDVVGLRGIFVWTRNVDMARNDEGLKAFVDILK